MRKRGAVFSSPQINSKNVPLKMFAFSVKDQEQNPEVFLGF